METPGLASNAFLLALGEISSHGAKGKPFSIVLNLPLDA